MDVRERSAVLQQYAWDHLDYRELLKRIAGYASSELGELAVRGLQPFTERWAVERRLDLVAELREFLDHSRPPMAGIFNLRSLLRRAEKGAVLMPDELARVRQSLQAAHRLKRYFFRADGEYPQLQSLVSPLAQTPDLQSLLEQSLTEEGEVDDRASAELLRLRRAIRSKSDQLRARLDDMVKGNASRYLQENLITQRNDRFVVPVRQEYRNQVTGIVHGQSASGATVFIEPQFAVDLNNEIQNLRSEEEREVVRILRWLSGQVGEVAETLYQEQDILQELDLIYAAAGYAHALDCVRPQINEEDFVLLYGARHPLIPREDVVPIDVEIGLDFDTLVITGPNTGGKTVTLKTVGLLVLMAQSGLHVPAARESNLGLFRSVYCDIGDEQSIDQNLSTFSSHMRNVIPIVDVADRHSLVLLDELGAGTDPSEGAPLALSILHTLHFAGVRTMATTHYSQLKSFAYLVDGVANASMEFDIGTLSPTYRLLMGTPGRSNALEIATRLGMSPTVINRARTFMSDDDSQQDDIFEAIAEDRKVWAEKRHMAEDEARDAQKMRERLTRREEYLRNVQKDIITDARREAKRILAQSQDQANQVLKEIHRLAHQLNVSRDREEGTDAREVLRSAETLRHQVASIRDETGRSIEDLQHRLLGHTEPDSFSTAAELKEADLAEGSYVRVKSIDQKGWIIDLNVEGGEAQVRIGALKMRVKLDDLVAEEDPAERASQSSIQHLGRVKGEFISDSLTIRQLTVDEALPKVMKYLDDALLAGRSHVTIIHGYGAGILRDAVRRYLDEHPQVAKWRPGDRTEGADGVTIVDLQ